MIRSKLAFDGPRRPTAVRGVRLGPAGVRRSQALERRERSRLAIAVGLLLTAMAPVALFAQSGAGGPIATLPLHSSLGTDDFFYLDLADGSLIHGDQLRRDPLSIRAHRLSQNLFTDIGRPRDQPAIPGEILLAPIFDRSKVHAALFVETTTGFVAFFDQLGRSSTFGRITTYIGRPFAPLTALDGNFALLMRRDSSGRTEGAYLYHATTGKGLYIGGMIKLETDSPVATTSALPSLTGQVCAVDLQSSAERTVSFLIVDSGDGSLRYFDLQARVEQIVVRASPISLFPTFPAEAGNPMARRFVAVPILSSDDSTAHVFFVDNATGGMALLENVAAGGQPVLRKLDLNLYETLGTAAGTGLRTIAAIPGLASNGSTNGIWLIDSAGRGTAYVANPGNPGAATLRRTVRR